ncbi:MAG TPA: hypothetical protein VGX16_04235 [Solirubrobacteraceae bacterium]|jgi:hypothetical protein|nr:hypothetical protein [Solirubrobacteraceae bacterium]
MTRPREPLLRTWIVLGVFLGSILLVLIVARPGTEARRGAPLADSASGASGRAEGSNGDPGPSPSSSGASFSEPPSEGALATRAPTGVPVELTVGARAVAPSAPRDFLGLSFEAADLPRIGAYATRGNLRALLDGLGPEVLRFGGVSADRETAWGAPHAPPPSWARRVITPHALSALATLARETRSRVLLTVNLGRYDPRAAALEARAARAILGPSLAGVELGNEPDAYVRQHMRPPGWGIAAYRPQAAAYRAALARAAPGVPILAPDASSGLPGLAWVRAVALRDPGSPLADHYYPSSSCGYAPTVSDLLSPRTRRVETGMLALIARLARGGAPHAIPLRLDETNNISCEGQAGVSNAFVSALWALDYIARALRAGIPGVNFHDLIRKPAAYSPIAASDRAALISGRLHANPEYYALLAARTLPGAAPLATHLSGLVEGQRASESLTAHAFLRPDRRLELVLVDFAPPGAPPLLLRLRPPGDFRAGSILRLRAPSPASLAGVTLGGRAVRADGTWSPEPRLPGPYRHAGTLSLQMPPSSAAVVILRR